MKRVAVKITILIVLFSSGNELFSQGRMDHMISVDNALDFGNKKSAKAQFYVTQDIGISVGTSYYLGDLNPRKHFGTTLHPGVGGMYRLNFTRRWSLKFSLLQATVEAIDANSTDPWQQNRNLAFKNDITEGAMSFELNFFDYTVGGKQKYIPVSPYFFAGVAYYKMKPQGLFNSTWYELQPLGTEGQGLNGTKRYKLTGISVPFGVGIKANVFKIIELSAEWGMRKTWSDYFDDVSDIYPDQVLLSNENGDLAAFFSDQSLEGQLENGTNTGVQRGDPGKNDWYSIAQVTLAFRITKAKPSCWKGVNYRN